MLKKINIKSINKNEYLSLDKNKCIHLIYIKDVSFHEIDKLRQEDFFLINHYPYYRRSELNIDKTIVVLENIPFSEYQNVFKTLDSIYRMKTIELMIYVYYIR